MNEETDFSTKTCIPCQGGVPALNEEEIGGFMSKIDSRWEVIENHHLYREWKFSDFKTALDFVNIAGNICEVENHHADFELCWGSVKVKIFTHKIDGLVESDFILAAKFDKI